MDMTVKAQEARGSSVPGTSLRATVTRRFKSELKLLY